MENLKDSDIILSKSVFLDSDPFRTQRNNNVLVVGSSGGGKTRYVVKPNLLQHYGSYVISDPKGALYEEFAPFFRKHGYKIQVLNLMHPSESDIYNPFRYLTRETDYIRFAHNLMYAMGGPTLREDPFWDLAGQLLLTALTALAGENFKEEERNLGTVLEILSNCEVREDDEDYKSVIDEMIEELSRTEPECFTVRQYTKFRQAAGKTMKSILITINAKLGILDTKVLRAMLGDKDAAKEVCFGEDKEEIDITNIGEENTAIFVISSDTDHSLDLVANVFYTQVFQELCRYADNPALCEGGRLPVPVRFILDDFAASARIPDFESLVATIRSRGISVMAILQSESQLWAQYGQHAQTIIGNCDIYLYLGGNDLETARNIAERLNCPVGNVLYMETGKMYVFVRGRYPLLDERFPLEEHPAWQELEDCLEEDDAFWEEWMDREELTLDIPSLW